MCLNLREIVVQTVQPGEEGRFQRLMQAHHYLGALPKIGETLWYVATWRGEWLALLSFSAAAWKCAARDRWIGWDCRRQYDRLHLIAHNSRLLILPDHHVPNLASRILSQCERRLAHDWRQRFGHPLLLLDYQVPSQSILRDVLIRVDPTHLDRAFQRWNAVHAPTDEGLAIDGKTLRNALDEAGRQTHVLSAVGHQTAICYTPKKSVPCR